MILKNVECTVALKGRRFDARHSCNRRFDAFNRRFDACNRRFDARSIV